MFTSEQVQKNMSFELMYDDDDDNDDKGHDRPIMLCVHVPSQNVVCKLPSCPSVWDQLSATSS